MSVRISLTQVPGAGAVVDHEDFFDLASKYQMLEDIWWENPELAVALHQNRVYFTITDDDKRIGYIWIDGYLKGARRAEIGFLVERGYRGKWRGEAWKELVDVLQICFTDPVSGKTGLGLPRLTVYLERGRSNASKFLKKLGFDYEGKMRLLLKIGGRQRDALAFGLTAKHFNVLLDKGFYNGGSIHNRGAGESGDQHRESTVRGQEPGQVRLSGDGRSPGVVEEGARVNVEPNLGT